jgi:hypothetical protein
VKRVKKMKRNVGMEEDPSDAPNVREIISWDPL